MIDFPCQLNKNEMYGKHRVQDRSIIQFSAGCESLQTVWEGLQNVANFPKLNQYNIIKEISSILDFLE